jgi:hypothetical protein
MILSGLAERLMDASFITTLCAQSDIGATSIALAKMIVLIGLIVYLLSIEFSGFMGLHISPVNVSSGVNLALHPVRREPDVENRHAGQNRLPLTKAQVVLKRGHEKVVSEVFL